MLCINLLSMGPAQQQQHTSMEYWRDEASKQGWRFTHKAGGPSATVCVPLDLTVCPKGDFDTVSAVVMAHVPQMYLQQMAAACILVVTGPELEDVIMFCCC